MNLKQDLLKLILCSVVGYLLFTDIHTPAIATDSNLLLEEEIFMDRTAQEGEGLSGEEEYFLSSTVPDTEFSSIDEPPSPPELTATWSEDFPEVVVNNGGEEYYVSPPPPIEPEPYYGLAQRYPPPAEIPARSTPLPSIGLEESPSTQPFPQAEPVQLMEVKPSPSPPSFTAAQLPKRMRLALIPILNQLRYPLPFLARISSGFGWRMHPISGTQRFHAGIDLAVPRGSTVLAADSGKVELADWQGGYGKTILLSHPRHKTRYAHLSEILVHPGQRVRQGSVIGLVGSTGDSTGPHLHFEVLQETADGLKPVDPGPQLRLASRRLELISAH